MTIFVDELREYNTLGHKYWCHLWSDDCDEELDRFAKQIGLKLHWAQVSHSGILGRFYHYDLTEGKRRIAIDRGAVEVQLQGYLRSFIQKGFKDENE